MQFLKTIIIFVKQIIFFKNIFQPSKFIKSMFMRCLQTFNLIIYDFKKLTLKSAFKNKDLLNNLISDYRYLCIFSN